MKVYFPILLAACALCPFPSEAGVKPGAVAFRFDDNQQPAVWQKIQAVFKKHGVPFSCAIVSGQLPPNGPQAETLRAIVRDGGEIMDHSPSHSCMRMVFPTATAAQAFKGHPGVEKIHHNVVFLRLAFNPRYPYNRQLNVTVKDGRLVNPDDQVKRNLAGQDFLIFPDGKIYGVRKKNGEYTLCTPWETPCDVADGPVAVIRTDRFGLQPTDDALRLLATTARKNFEALGLPPPQSFITPGGWGVYPNAQLLHRIYGKEFGYKAGDAYSRWSGLYGRHNDWERFRLAPNWDSLERKSVAEAKKQIADLVAKHHVTIFISHFWTKGVPGGEAELLRRNDELLTWLKAKKIPVLTVAQCAAQLFDRPAARDGNLMPPLEVDLDEDGTPDGYELNAGTVVKAEQIERTTPGELFAIRQLGGLEAGKNTFSCKVDAPAGTVICVKAGLCGDVVRNVTRQLPEWKFTVKTPGETLRWTFDVPAWSPALDLRCSATGAGKISLSELSLKANE